MGGRDILKIVTWRCSLSQQELGNLQLTSYMDCMGKGEFIDFIFIEMMFLHTLEMDARSMNSLALGLLIPLITEG